MTKQKDAKAIRAPAVFRKSRCVSRFPSRPFLPHEAPHDLALSSSSPRRRPLMLHLLLVASSGLHLSAPCTPGHLRCPAPVCKLGRRELIATTAYVAKTAACSRARFSLLTFEMV